MSSRQLLTFIDDLQHYIYDNGLEQKDAQKEL